MRPRSHSTRPGRVLGPVSLLALALAPALAHADDTAATASGALGAGAFADQPVATFELGVDVSGDRYAVGLGARLRVLAEDGVRGEDWDEASEIAGLVRYALFHHVDESWEIATALGELGGARLGDGAVIDGYVSGIDADHGKLGAQLRVRRGEATGELMVDDVVAPHIGGLRGAVMLPGDVELGVSAAGDRSAPDAAMDTTSVVGAIAGDLHLRRGTDDGRWLGTVRSEAVLVLGLGAGLHAGAAGEVALEPVTLGADLELRLGTSGYVPGWIGALYQRDRLVVDRDEGQVPGLLAASRMGGLGGVSGAARAFARADAIGTVELGYSQRPGLDDVVTARLQLPYFHQAQAAVWAAAETGGGEISASALAAELRVRLPHRMFVGAEMARQFRSAEDGSLEPIWSLTAAIGAVLGEQR